MNDEQRARAILAALTPLPDPADAHGPALDARKPEALAKLQELVARHEAARSRPRVGVAWLVAAAALLVAGVSYSLASGSPELAEARLKGAGMVRLGAGAPSQLAERLGPLPAASELEVLDDRGVELVTAGGIALTMARPARVALRGLASATAPHLQLLSGTVRAKVPKLPRGRTFSISTPNARVVVLGTEFSVTWRADAEDTCVSVVEGVVSVIRGGSTSRLSAGETSGCGPTPTAPSAPSATAEATRSLPAEPGARAASAAPRLHAPPRPRPGSDSLARANHLLRSALQLEQERRLTEAEGRLQELLRVDPRSPLAPDARDALQRIARARRMERAEP